MVLYTKHRCTAGAATGTDETGTAYCCYALFIRVVCGEFRAYIGNDAGRISKTCDRYNAKTYMLKIMTNIDTAQTEDKGVVFRKVAELCDVLHTLLFDQ